MVGVVAHQRGQGEGHRNSVLPLREQVPETPIGVLGRTEARELTHGPQPAAIHRWMNAASVGRLAGNAQFARRIRSREITRRVKTLDCMAGNRCELGRTLWRFLQSGAV